MSGKYQLSATALRTLEKEIEYSKAKWGKAHANKYRKELFATIRKLAKMPTLHAEQPDLGKGIRRVRFKGNYIIYRPNDIGDGIIVTNLPSVYKNT